MMNQKNFSLRRRPVFMKQNAPHAKFTKPNTPQDMFCDYTNPDGSLSW